MKKRDFKTYNIKHFSVNEVLSTGANLEGLKIATLTTLERLRVRFGQPIHLLKNGMNSGNHKSREHPAGEAVDVFVENVNDPMDVIRIAIEEGFKGIGVYWNNETELWTFHFDVGRTRFWTARKESTRDRWRYHNTFTIPSY